MALAGTKKKASSAPKRRRRRAAPPPGAKRIRYRPTPTGASFHASRARVRGIKGPFGSGKSVMCVMEIIAQAMTMPPCKDGVRRCRWVAIRNTYSELKSTTIKTWEDWFPMAPVVYDAPIRSVLRIPMDDGDVELEMLFLSLDKPKDLKKLKGLELTGAWINEAVEIPYAIVETVLGRCGRFPKKSDCRKRYWSGVIMDTNPPDTDHWWYRLAEQEKPRGYQFFSQPPAVVQPKKGGDWVANDGSYGMPAAENVENQILGYDYWLDQVPGKSREWIKVFLCGQYGSTLDGQPVYTEYNDEIHCAEDVLEPMRGIELILGWDFGRTPSCIVCQITPRGQFRVLDEYVVEADGKGMGLQLFARNVVKPALLNKYRGMTFRSYGDPAGRSKDNYEQDCFSILAAEGIPTEEAPCDNTIDPRLSAVRKQLNSMVDGQPAFLVSINCHMIRKGFLVGYRYTRVQVTGEARYRDVPDKNKYSHPHDGLQYAVIGGTHIEVRSSTTARQVAAARSF